MRKASWKSIWLGALLTSAVALPASSQAPLSWQEVRDRFEKENPSLIAGAVNIDESRAQEVTAYLRPNPNFTLSSDGIQAAPNNGVWQPLSGSTVSPNFSYLHERQHKRELRLQSARDATRIATSTQSDLERTLLFTLRGSFVQTLQQKAIRNLAKDNLAYYDRVLDVNRERFKAGAIAQVDLDRLELQRVTYESDLQTAEVNLRTAKIQLLALLNERTPVEQFDVTGPFDFSKALPQLDGVRQQALDTRPDLRAALQAAAKARTDYQLAVANGSTDPTFSTWYTHNASFNNPFAKETVGVSVSVPLRIFDRNQGEKERTRLDILRNERLTDAARAQVFSDVDSAYTTVSSSVALLQPYKDRYLEQATRVRETILFSYENGGASLLDFLNAQADYRSVQVAYLNLVAAYLNAANQLNEAVGREVIP